MTKLEKTPEEKPLRVLRVLAENYKRVEFAELHPTRRVTKLLGKNGHGKSTLAEAAIKAIGGKRAREGVNLREGAEEGRIEVDLGSDNVELSVELALLPNGEEELRVRNADGVPQKGPQSLLDKLIGPQRSQLDPLGFLRLSPKEQAEKMQIALGLDFAALDKEHGEKFSERTVVNREVDRAKARLSALPRLQQDPPEMVDLAVVLAEQERLQAVQRGNDALESAVREQSTRREGAKKEYLAADAALKRAEADLKAAEESVVRLKTQVADGKTKLDALEQHGKQVAEALTAAEQKVAGAEDVSFALAEVRQKLEEANARNESNALANAKAKEREEVAADLKRKESESATLTKRLTAIDAEKIRQIKEATETFPVKGIGFTQAGLTVNQLPFEQASQAEQLRIAVALGICDKPRFRTMTIKEGSFLDNDSMDLLEGILEEFDAYAFVEVVDPDGKGADGRGPCVVIRLGRIAEVRE